MSDASATANEKNSEVESEHTLNKAMHLVLPPPEPLDLSSGNVSESWKKFRQKYTNYEIATGIHTKESATRVATFLTIIGNDAIDVFNTLTWDFVGDDKKIEKVIQKFEEFCEPRKKLSYERYKFFFRAQDSDETIDQYVTVLRKLSETGEFGTLKNSLIKDRIVLGVNNVKTRERLLRVPDLTLEKAFDVVRSAEATEKQIKELENDASVYGVKREKITPPNWKTPRNNEAKRISKKTFNCRNCGTRHGARECPAYGKTCHHCYKQHHFKACAGQEKTFMA